MDRGPIPGWAPADERSLTGDAARRPVGAVVGEAFGLYRRHARPLLLMTAVLEVPATLLALPYLILTWSVLAESLASLPSIGDLAVPDGQGGASVIFWTSRLHGPLPRPRRPAGRCARRRRGHPALRGHDHPGRALRSLPAGTGLGHAESARGRSANAPSLAAAAPRERRPSSSPGRSWVSSPPWSTLERSTPSWPEARICHPPQSSLGFGLASLLLFGAGVYVIARCAFVPQAADPRSDRPALGGPAQRPPDAPARPPCGLDPRPGRPDHRLSRAG